MFQFAPKGNAVSQTRKILVAVLPLIFLSSTVFAVDTSNMTIDQRLKRLEAAMDNNSMVDIFLKLENLQKEVESMRGELELISHDFRGIKKQQKDLYLDLDQRIQETNQAIADVAAQASSMVSGGGFGSSSALGSAGEESEVGMDEQRAYQDAFNFLKNSEYDKAVAAFQSFLKT
ncbi:MAG: hypothetical protein OEZ58_00575, partial [Gammaproteobacteria bacterium]|nr:hypothetical protein [Gammaproteobacteria bacterium]